MVKKVLSVILAMVMLLGVFAVVSLAATAKKDCPADCEFICIECIMEYSPEERQALIEEVAAKDPAKAAEIFKVFYEENFGFLGKVINFLLFTHPVLAVVSEPFIQVLLVLFGPAAVMLNMIF